MTVELDEFITEDRAVFGSLATLHNIIRGIVFHAGHKDDPLLASVVEKRIVGVSLVKNHDTARRKGKFLSNHPLGNPHLARLAIGHMGEGGQIAVMVQDQMQCDRPLGPPEVSPVEEAQAQLDEGCVHAEEPVLEAKLPLPPVILPRLPQQMIERLFIDLPRSMLIGTGQGGPLRALLQPQMVQLAHTAGQATANLPLRLGLAQLSKQHAHKLIPARKSFRVPVSSMLTHDAPKSIAISKIYNLCKKICTFERHMPLRFVELC